MIFGKKIFIGILSAMVVLAVLAVPVYAAGTPQINITSPKDGAQVPAGNVTVMVKVTNLELSNKLGSSNVAGQGHIHYYMDVAVPKTSGKPAITASGTYAPTANTSFTWKNVTPGKHNLSVQLVNNDHTPLIPLVYSEVNVTVAANKTTLKTMSTQKDPQNTTQNATKSVTIDLIAKNVAFNTSTITVPAGANVTVNFDNQDANVPHNLAVYTNSSATTPIFVGKTITGPAKTTYTFTAPSKPGTYFFRCDTHRTTMTGQFIVK